MTQHRTEYMRDYMRERRAEQRQPKTCIECGLEFDRRGGKKFCSDECYHQSRLRWRRENEYQPAPLTCVECGSPIAYKSGRRRFCSESCSTRSETKRRRWVVKGLAEEPPETIQCAVCGVETTKYHIDHDHTCCPGDRRCCGKCFRGFLCRSCNVGLGMFKENDQLLEAAAAYLRSHR